MPPAAEVEEWAKEDSHDEGKQEEVLQFVIKDKVSNICYRGGAYFQYSSLSHEFPFAPSVHCVPPRWMNEWMNEPSALQPHHLPPPLIKTTRHADWRTGWLSKLIMPVHSIIPLLLLLVLYWVASIHPSIEVLSHGILPLWTGYGPSYSYILTFDSGYPSMDNVSSIYPAQVLWLANMEKLKLIDQLIACCACVWQECGDLRWIRPPKTPQAMYIHTYIPYDDLSIYLCCSNSHNHSKHGNANCAVNEIINSLLLYYMCTRPDQQQQQLSQSVQFGSHCVFCSVSRHCTTL